MPAAAVGTRPAADSIRMPHTFLPPTRTSLGHLIRAGRPARRRTAVATATAAHAVRTAGQRAAGGRARATPSRTPAPGGLTQDRPYWPRPAVWVPARTAVPAWVESAARAAATGRVLGSSA